MLIAWTSYLNHPGFKQSLYMIVNVLNGGVIANSQQEDGLYVPGGHRRRIPQPVRAQDQHCNQENGTAPSYL